VFAIRMKSDIISWPDCNGARTEEKYCVKPGSWCGLVMLFSCANGEPLGFINDGEISRIRVGAAAAIGVRHLARVNALRRAAPFGLSRRRCQKSSCARKSGMRRNSP
jgi:alanine dehydrogenase